MIGFGFMNLYFSAIFLRPPKQDKKLLEQLVGSDPALFRRIFMEIPSGFEESEERWRRLVWSYLEDIASPKLTAGALQGLQGRLQLTDYFHVNNLCQMLSLSKRGTGSELTLLFGQAKRELAAKALQGYQALGQHEKGAAELALMEQLRARVMEHERRRRKRKIATFGVANLCMLGFWAFCFSVVYSHMFPRLSLMDPRGTIPTLIGVLLFCFVTGVVEIGTFIGKLKPADKNLLERAVRDNPRSLLLLLANAAPSYQRSDRWRDAVFRFVAAGQDATLNKLFLEALRGHLIPEDDARVSFLLPVGIRALQTPSERRSVSEPEKPEDREWRKLYIEADAEMMLKSLLRPSQVPSTPVEELLRITGPASSPSLGAEASADQLLRGSVVPPENADNGQTTSP
ncbi:hypothetical protein [Chthonomonas sp.]|uniref:hypothetical protein n=1 Tax=Chthonomonas sp. TaxID=2282153 RepID=UPI002B4B4CA7|nr:hypothetical protein [Chthonomonas sp.]